MRNVTLGLFVFLLYRSTAPAAGDSVDVVFRYTPQGSPSLVHLPGEFNNWANNSSGSITPNPLWTMTKGPGGVWEKTVRLKVGGGTGPGGSYQYKFNENGSSGGWLADPLNPRTTGSFGNSIVYVQKPTILHVQPVLNMVINTADPAILADVFPPVGSGIDTARSTVYVRGAAVGSFGSRYDTASRSLVFTPTGVTDGPCTVVVEAYDTQGNVARDSTSFIVRAAPLQWLSRDNPSVPDTAVTITGMVASGIATDLVVIRNRIDTLMPARNGALFAADVTLREGRNTFVATGLDGGARITSDTLVLTHPVDHAPRAVIMIGSSMGQVRLNAYASSDPDGDPLTFSWQSEDAANPAPLHIAAAGAEISFPRPSVPGEYFFTLVARDPAGNAGRVRNYITVAGDSVELGASRTNPRWVRDAIVYEIFVPSFSPTKNLAGITAKLPYLRSLGVNTLWLMPIFDNRGTVNEFNGGYDIIDFYAVEPDLGDLASFRTLVDSCHANGIRVILDITPNHVSDQHPWVNDIRAWGEYSIYRPFIETRILGGDRGLGQSVVQYNGAPLYAHYSNWSLANLNLSNEVTRDAMMDVFHFWVDSMRADGFRMDVYWGPQNRYGAPVFWEKFRTDIKRSKPEIFVLGETDGTGTGSEVNYADAGGACDAAYDWNLYGQIKASLASGDITTLHNRVINFSNTDAYNYWTGPDAHYLRFMENHDEDRIAKVFASNIERTKPGAVLLMTAPGIPMVYAGQEVGWKGRRDPIDFNNPSAAALFPYYQKLIGIRNRFPALRTPFLKRLPTSASSVYAYLRPMMDENFIVALSLNPSTVSVDLSIDSSDLRLSKPLYIGNTMYLNDLMAEVSYSFPYGQDKGKILASIPLQAFQSRVMSLTDSAWFITVPVEEPPATDPASSGFMLEQNHPNPFSAGNGRTEIRYTLPARPGRYRVELSVFDMLGRKVATLVSGTQDSGAHVVGFPGDAATRLAAGCYRYRLDVSGPDNAAFTMTKWMIVQ